MSPLIINGMALLWCLGNKNILRPPTEGYGIEKSIILVEVNFSLCSQGPIALSLAMGEVWLCL